MKTGLFRLAGSDLLKGFIVTVLTSVLTGAITIMNAGDIPLDFPSWKPTLIAGITAGISYLLKNFLTNSQDQFLKKEEAK